MPLDENQKKNDEDICQILNARLNIPALPKKILTFGNSKKQINSLSKKDNVQSFGKSMMLIVNEDRKNNEKEFPEEQNLPIDFKVNQI